MVLAQKALPGETPKKTENSRFGRYRILSFIAWQEIRDPEWSVTRYFTPLIGGEPLAEVVKINIFAYYEGMH